MAWLVEERRNAMDACYAAGVFTCLPLSLSLSVLMSNVDLSLPLKGAVVPGSARETPATRRPRSRDRKVEIFISNAACKVSGAPPLQVIFMGPLRSNELIFTFYAFIPRASTAWPRTARLESIPTTDFGTDDLAKRQKNCPGFPPRL